MILSTASTSRDTRYFIAGSGLDLRSFTFSDDGQKLFIGDAKNDKIYQYSLTNAFDVTPGL